MMWSRWFSRLLVLGAIATLAAVTYYFMHEYLSLREREHVLVSLRQVSLEDGPCAAMVAARRLAGGSADLEYTLEQLRHGFALQIAGDGDPRGKKAILVAESEG